MRSNVILALVPGFVKGVYTVRKNGFMSNVALYMGFRSVEWAERESLGGCGFPGLAL
ncbi:MAG TPA: hypothetical protein PKY78_00115 [Candidatus Omnitrophota bacterium]|nr:hypothetical protein [Candidatus Omnitrophota bacterium]HPS19380.1 hypothetical protein [Candidatus Omnitrophota bacterium]